MEAILHLDLMAILTTIFEVAGIGYIVIFAIIFSESGLLIGIFFPGDSLLFTAGLLASRGVLNVWILVAITFVAAVSGDSVGYAFGHKVGPMLFKRENSRIFKKENLLRAESFYERHGSKTIVLARFIPIIRTFAPIVAGVGKMKYRTFIIYNVVGGALWSLSVPLIGYYLIRLLPKKYQAAVDKYLILIVFLIIVVSAIPAFLEYIKSKREKKAHKQEPVADKENK
jgi:membrane-associated protein